MGFIQAHGGIIGVMLVVLPIFNAVLMALSKIFAALGKAAPGWIGSAMTIVSKVIDFASANTAHPQAPTVVIAPTPAEPPKAA